MLLHFVVNQALNRAVNIMPVANRVVDIVMRLETRTVRVRMGGKVHVRSDFASALEVNIMLDISVD